METGKGPSTCRNQTSWNTGWKMAVSSLCGPPVRSPKIKIYLSGKGSTRAESEAVIEKMKAAVPAFWESK